MRTNRTFSILTVVGLFALSSGMAALGGNCDVTGLPSNGNNNNNVCGDQGRPAILLTIANEDGDIIGRSGISVRHNLGTAQTGGCHEDFPCEEFPIGINLFGRFDITVSPPGYASESRTVNIASNDNCNPATEDVIIVVTPDATVAALAGAWRTTNVFGTQDVRFNSNGKIVGAIQYDRQAGGDGNFYISYNNRDIAGAFGQDIFYTNAEEPSRTGDNFTWSTTTLGMPIGFESASMSDDFLTLQGTLANTTVFYERLDEIPAALRDP